MSQDIARTRTGSFPIGFRATGPRWRESIEQVIAFARGEGFAGVDVGPQPIDVLKKVAAAGLQLGSIDLVQPWQALASADAGKRKDAVARNAQYIRDAVQQAGARNFFTVILPEKPDGNRLENYKLAVEGYGALCEAIKDTGAKIVIEGWPGGWPHFAALACTPEGYRAILKDTPANVMAVNFDPSHLVRMGIDPVRFLDEFAPRVAHVHGKDTEIRSEDLYEFGNLQPATFAKAHGFGSHCWRYTIPGHGEVRWHRLFSQLQQAGYKGMVSIELEDENFNGTDEGEKRGFIASRDFLIYA